MNEKYRFIKLIIVNVAAALFVMTALFVIEDKNLAFTSGIGFLGTEVGYLLGKQGKTHKEQKRKKDSQ